MSTDTTTVTADANPALLERIQQLEQGQSELQEELRDTKDELEDVKEENRQLKQTLEITQQSLWDLEDVVLGEWDTTRPRFEEQSIVDQLDELESDVEDAKGRVEGPKTTLQNTLLAESPLEQVCGMTDREAKDHLSENQYRATRVALVANQIGKKTPKGYVVSNKKLREELAAMLGKYPNDGTVSRVRGFLNDMGKEHVRLIDHRGEKKVVIEKTYAKRLGNEYFAPEECVVVEHKRSWRDMVGIQVSRKDDTEASTAA